MVRACIKSETEATVPWLGLSVVFRSALVQSAGIMERLPSGRTTTSWSLPWRRV